MSCCSCPKQIVGQKRPHDAGGQDENQVKEEEDVEKKKAKFSEAQRDGRQEQSISADPGKEPHLTHFKHGSFKNKIA